MELDNDDDDDDQLNRKGKVMTATVANFNTDFGKAFDIT